MKYYVSLLALGDNLISLAFLRQLSDEIHVLGTKHTNNILKLIGSKENIHIHKVFEDIPAFYDIKKRGLISACRDFYKFIRYVRSNGIDELVFEKKDFRSTMIAILTKAKVFYPDSFVCNAYKNRRELISEVYKNDVALNTYKLELHDVKIVVINPLTRLEKRNIKHQHLSFMCKKLKQNGYETYLIDLEKKYTQLEEDVTHYLTNTSLEDVKELILKADLYIGADSFLIHLAYYLKKNFFMIFYRDNYDFLPPNIENSFYIQAHHCSDFESEVQQKFKSIGLV